MAQMFFSFLCITAYVRVRLPCALTASLCSYRARQISADKAGFVMSPIPYTNRAPCARRGPSVPLSHPFSSVALTASSGSAAADSEVGLLLLLCACPAAGARAHPSPAAGCDAQAFLGPRTPRSSKKPLPLSSPLTNQRGKNKIHGRTEPTGDERVRAEAV